MTSGRREKRNKYAKIPRKHKVMFLKRVIQDKQPLKITADLFKINYSTAKTLLRQFRIDHPSLEVQECQNTMSDYICDNSTQLKRCAFRLVQNVQDTKMLQPINNRSVSVDKNNLQGVFQKVQKSQQNGIKINHIQIISKIQFQ